MAPRTLAALGRLAGGAAAVGGAWGVYGVYASSMPMAQLDVHARITLRTQHVGWYLALLADAFASLGGVVAVLFGRGAILGPSQAQLRGREADERLLRVITHRPAPYQVGLTPRGERVMRTPRPAGAGETSRAHSGAFTRRDNFEEYKGGPATFRWGGKTANANANADAARARAASVAVGGGAGGRARAREAPVAIVEAGQSGWEAFKANFWSARGGEPSGVSGAAGTTASAAAKYAVGGAEAKGEEDRDGSASAYRVERDRRVGRLTGLLTGGFGRGGTAKPTTAPGTASNKPAGTTTAGTNTPGNKPVFAFRFPAAEPTPTASASAPAPAPERQRPPSTPVPAYELSSSSSEDEHEDPASPPLLSPSKRQTRRERAAASRATAAPVPELSLRQRAELGRL